MEIRLLTREDYDEVYAMWVGTPGIGMRSLDDSREGIARFLHRNPATCFVALSHGQLVGVILCGHDGRRGFIYHTVVMPEHRRQGIGRALVAAALGALRKEGIHKVALVVYRTNESGNHFWKSLGFEQRNDLVYRNYSLNTENF